MTVLVEQHLVRLSEDGRSPVTLATYRFAVGKLEKFIGGVRVGEASPARRATSGRRNAALIVSNPRHVNDTSAISTVRVYFETDAGDGRATLRGEA